jgi:hypothetical protein
MPIGQQPARQVYTLDLNGDTYDDNSHLQDYLAFCHQVMIPGRTRQSPNRERPVPNLERSACRCNKRAPFNGACSACEWFGHKAVKCDHLAMFIFLSWYVKSIDADAVLAVKERWIDKNKKWLSSDAKPPLKVAASYLGISGLTINQVDAEIDWEFFTDTKDTDLADE